MEFPTWHAARKTAFWKVKERNDSEKVRTRAPNRGEREHERAPRAREAAAAAPPFPRRQEGLSLCHPPPQPPPPPTGQPPPTPATPPRRPLACRPGLLPLPPPPIPPHAREDLRVDREPADGVRARRRLHERVPQLDGRLPNGFGRPCRLCGGGCVEVLGWHTIRTP